MSERKNPLDIFGKLVEDIIINPTREFIEPLLQPPKSPEKKSLLPETETAIFWDYENFPIPKDIDPEIFLEALFPLGQTHRYATKRVYGNTASFNSGVLEILKKNGFEHYIALETNKPNRTDHMIMPNSASFCAQYQTSLVVILISGDIDFLSTIQNISSKGHDVRLICRKKRKLNPTLKKIVPLILDNDDIKLRCKNLSQSLLSLSQMVNYMISVHPSRSLSLHEFRKEIEEQVLQERLKTLVGHLQFILKSSGYKWQYTTNNGIISQNSKFVNPIGDAKRKEKEAIQIRLGSESNKYRWEENYRNFERLFPSPNARREILFGIYKLNSLPIIRSRIQQKLINLLALEQSTQQITTPKKKIAEKTEFKCAKCKNSTRLFKTKRALKQHMEAKHKKK